MVTYEVLEAFDVLEDFLVKDLKVVPTEVELLQVVKSVENPWRQLSELVLIQVQLLKDHDGDIVEYDVRYDHNDDDKDDGSYYANDNDDDFDDCTSRWGI